MSLTYKSWQGITNNGSLHVIPDNSNPHTALIVADPLQKGYGSTLGNSLRRVLLSSLYGVAVTKIKINGILHEFSTVNGVQEDVSEIIMNVKRLNLKSGLDSVKKIFLQANKSGPVYARDIDVTGTDIEIMNPDLLICTLGSDANFQMEMTVEGGVGYVAGSDNRKDDLPVGVIPIDSIFSPVRMVSYQVENTRVGNVTDYDRLIMKVQTNGAIRPEDAVACSARILQEFCRLFINFEDPKVESKDSANDEFAYNQHLFERVDNLELSVRASNCLKNDNIVYVGDLVRKTEAEMMGTPNFGKKSLDEITKVLEKFGLTLGMNIPNWPPENLEERSKQFKEKGKLS